MSLILVPIALLGAVAILALVLLALGDAIPGQIEAVLVAISVVTLVTTILYTRMPYLRLWVIRVRARLGKGYAPTWRVSIGLRARVGPDDKDLLTERLGRRLPRAVLVFERELLAHVELDGMRVAIEWRKRLRDEDRDVVDWDIALSSTRSSVPYHDSIRFLRDELMPMVEAIDEALEAVSREYHLTVDYGSAGNPFEGLILQTAPAETLVSYQVRMRTSRGESIVLDKDRLLVDVGSRSRFEEVVQDLLTLDRAWGGRLSDPGDA